MHGRPEELEPKAGDHHRQEGIPHGTTEMVPSEGIPCRINRQQQTSDARDDATRLVAPEECSQAVCTVDGREAAVSASPAVGPNRKRV